jgi:hypothetical protein
LAEGQGAFGRSDWHERRLRTPPRQGLVALSIFDGQGWKRQRTGNCGEVALIGNAWCGIHSETLSRSALVDKLHVCEIRPDRLAEIKKHTNAATATLDYQDIVKNDDIKVVTSARRRNTPTSRSRAIA